MHDAIIFACFLCVMQDQMDGGRQATSHTNLQHALLVEFAETSVQLEAVAARHQNAQALLEQLLEKMEEMVSTTLSI
jgi:hypothetical protein